MSIEHTVRHGAAAFALALVLTGCSEAESDTAAGADSAILEDGPEAMITELGADQIPEGARAAALEAVPKMSFAGAERKERDGMVFFDVEGTRADGSEVELDMLLEDGADVVAVGSLQEGLDQAEAGVFDFAILDINLHGEKSYPIAHELGRKGVKFVFASGYGDAEHPSELAHVTTLTKPYVLAEIRDMAVAG